MKKRLVRKDKKFLGVCGGLGDYFDKDPTFIRILFIASVLLFGTGILLYFIMAIVMPDETNSPN